MSETVLQKGSEVMAGGHLVISRGEEKTVVVEQLQDMTVTLEEGAKLTFVLLAKDGWDGSGDGTVEERPKLKFDFVGRNSELNFLGFVVGRGDAKFPFETISKHRVPQTKAHYHVKAAMYDASHMDYTGTLVIDKSAQLADVYLASHTLLLSDKARARTIPALEIEADDVVAGHAATIGKIDRKLLFYVKSRGISADEAERVLISGFFESQLKMIGDEQVREDLRRSIVKSLPFSYES